MRKNYRNTYLNFISELKQHIIKSRLLAARLANREQLLLYITVGRHLSEKINAEKWGAKVLQQIAADLQTELPGLRGFSERNLKNMRQFAGEYAGQLIGQLPTAQITITAGKPPQKPIGQLATAQLKKTAQKPAALMPPERLQEKAVVFSQEQYGWFFSISFTHHILLLNKCPRMEERLFYMQLAASQMMSVETLASSIDSKTYRKRGRLPNNFSTALPPALKASALDVFRDEYLFDFMDFDDTGDERVFEAALVANIKKFILSLGRGFTFIGNQHRLELGGREYAADLLFYNRILQCLVAFELKRGRFKPEYAGKLNFYLNLLDDRVRLPHENPSIGIILCREKNNAEVEYAFRNMGKAMGVATYKMSREVPREMKDILPDAATLKKVITGGGRSIKQAPKTKGLRSGKKTRKK